jgi:hypothetical protein
VVHGQSRRVGPGRNGPRVDGGMWPAASHGRIHEPERGKVGEWEGLSCDVESSNYVLVLSLSLGSSSSFTRWTLQRVLCWCKDYNDYSIIFTCWLNHVKFTKKSSFLTMCVDHFQHFCWYHHNVVMSLEVCKLWWAASMLGVQRKQLSEALFSPGDGP